MIFVGGGALLSRAVSYSRSASLAVDVVCCGKGDSSIRSLRKHGAFVLETDDPNTDLLPLLSECSDGIALSTNNKHILGDNLLNAGVSFFNIHNGLIQQYRGIAEVCIFAGICRGEQRYGATLHRILPNQKIDSGPVIAQLRFDIGGDDVFSDVMRKSLDACQSIFEWNVEKLLDSTYTVEVVETSEVAYSYKDVARLCVEADSASFSRARGFGPYAEVFPKLKSIVESAR